ncbi:uncharacterized mitochondrial protein AtMg00810-like [Arachis stenosperma]|uniref:uncharacterized mitochondrial protein AtMg00810-like n=1 Tax=Arachis stenosperma TaxID=217475 RepID=UPI0025ACC949|nr:uncharacterized mitochondrial protein AtMg00810-like [Arachis stenosperma]
MEPRSVKQALDDPKWKSAMEFEFAALLRNNTWSLVPLPAGGKLLGASGYFASNTMMMVSTALRDLGFTTTKSDVSVFVRHTSSSLTYVLIYVDDILITGRSKSEISDVIQRLDSAFALKDMGPLHYFLGIQVTKTSDGGLLMTHSKYVQDLLLKAGMSGCKLCYTPLPSTLKIQATGGVEFANPHMYRSVVGSLQYLTITRPELAYNLDKASPTSLLTLKAYYDFDWTGDPNDCKSVGGFCVYLDRNLISWQYKKQGLVARSSTEDEYRALADLVVELIRIKGLISELKWSVSEAPMAYCDNQNAVLLAANPILHSKTKYFDIDLHFLRDYVARNEI